MRSVIVILSRFILMLFTFLLLFAGCKTTQMKEKVNVRDSIAIHYVDSIRWIYRDSTIIIYKYETVKDSSGLVIHFGNGGGTYNAKTGEATNVSGVQHSDTHFEQRDSSMYYKTIATDYQHICDSITSQLNTLQSDYEKQEKNLRTGYDKFCSTWFWITALLLVAKITCWILEKVPRTAPYVIIIRKYIPFL